MPELPDMTLVVNVTISGEVDGNGNLEMNPALYAEGSGSVPGGSNVVQGNGDLELSNMDYDPSTYNVDTDITFNLTGQITGQNGQPVNFYFPNNPSDACSVLLDGQPTSNITVSAGDGPMQLTVNDEDNDGDTYSYQLSVCVELPVSTGTTKTTVQLDPSIVNRRT